jgi:hypothetical protein
MVTHGSSDTVAATKAGGRTGPTFALAAGGWSGNIGNAFFNLGTQHVLSAAVPDSRVVLLSDQAAYWRMGPFGYRTEPANSLRYWERLRPDYVVLQGSVLTEQFPRVWGSALRALQAAGVKLLLVGVGYFDYSDREKAVCREFLSECRPYVLVSRDSETYDSLRGLAEHAHDGIDSAYFLPDVLQPVDADMPAYVVVNFDKGPEPVLEVSAEPAGTHGPGQQRALVEFPFGGRVWRASFPGARARLGACLGKWYPYVLGPLGLAGSTQEKVGDYTIVRTDHQVNPILLGKVFRGPNAFGGDIPYTYLNLYANAELTLSDRVHAVVATLAYGKPAMLFSKSGRARILERVGADTAALNPVRLDGLRLEAERQSEVDFLRAVPF